jgi:hypothetical protein
MYSILILENTFLKKDQTILYQLKILFLNTIIVV